MSDKKSLLWKPFTPQPRAAPANLNAPSPMAAERRKRHVESEEARGDGRRIMERDDLDVRGRQAYSFTALRQMTTAMRLWCEFFQEVLGRDDGPDYFREGGPLPDRLTLHRYFLYLSGALIGNLSSSSHEPSTVTDTDKPAVSTIINHQHFLQRAFSYYNTDIPAGLRESTTLWIKNDLAIEEGLNRETKQLQSIFWSDVVHIIRAIWKFDSLSVFHSIHAMFQMTLLLNLLVDGSSRCGEFVPDGNNDVVTGKYIRWGDIKFYMFPNEGAEPVTISAVITCRSLKGNESDPDNYKKFVVRLLPTHMIFEDSCRLLVILALHRGAFRDFHTWEELMSCEPRPNGSPVLVRPSFENEAVFTRQPLRTRPKDAVHAVGEEDPWRYDNVREIVQYLGRLAGFRHQVSLHHIRHGQAHLLLKHCKDREAAGSTMGHANATTIKDYLGKTCLTDVQSLTRNLEPQNLSPFQSVSLGLAYDAPVELPAEEVLLIYEDPEYAALDDRFTKLTAELTKNYGSIRKLRRQQRTPKLQLKNFASIRTYPGLGIVAGFG
ncbi:hypothetical protein SLS53_005084 [Cytospora paraplurivora]|uniref:Uncharacterized protein n=1 Tax=Cytospora paraplurivora TaxID=2898453 RepID=A0AAN9U6M8_9PEZI